MPHRLDDKVSRRLSKIMRKVEQMVTKEIGEPCFVAMLIQPAARDLVQQAQEPEAELQYISNSTREFARDAMGSMLAKWDVDDGIAHHIPYHMRPKR